MLGDGLAVGFSPDGAFVGGILTEPRHFVKYPVATGESVAIDFGQLERLELFGTWLPDGSPVACGNEKGHRSRCYLQDAGRLQPVTPEGMAAMLVSPDSKSLAIGPSRYALTRILPFGGADSQAIRDLMPDDFVVGWTRDSKSLIVQRHDLPARLERLDPVTGARVLIRTVGPADRAGLLGMWVTSALEDGRYYAYSYNRNLATLYVLTPGRETADGKK